MVFDDWGTILFCDGCLFFILLYAFRMKTILCIPFIYCTAIIVGVAIFVVRRECWRQRHRHFMHKFGVYNENLNVRQNNTQKCAHTYKRNKICIKKVASLTKTNTYSNTIAGNMKWERIEQQDNNTKHTNTHKTCSTKHKTAIMKYFVSVLLKWSEWSGNYMLHMDWDPTLEECLLSFWCICRTAEKFRKVIRKRENSILGA